MAGMSNQKNNSQGDDIRTKKQWVKKTIDIRVHHNGMFRNCARRIGISQKRLLEILLEEVFDAHPKLFK